MSPEEIKKATEAIQETSYAATVALADRVLAEVVAPFCDKHQLTFTAGMGTLAFSFIEDEGKPPREKRSIGGHTSFAEDDLKRFGIDPGDVKAALYADLGREGQLFEYMNSYDPRDTPSWNEPSQ